MLASFPTSQTRTATSSPLSRLFPFIQATLEHFSQQPTLLIMEEQPIAARLLAFTLRRSGFRALIAHNQHEVYLCLARFPVALLIIGLQPQRGGILPLVRNLRGQARYQQLPILGVSSQPSYALERVALKIGVTRHIVRPLRPQQLVNIIRELL